MGALFGPNVISKTLTMKHDAPNTNESDTLFRRCVFYIPGYDPFPPRRYREIYRQEGFRQAEISGYRFRFCADIKATGSKQYGWHACTNIGNQQSQADITFLAWADIVLKSMSSSVLGTYIELFKTAHTYIASGALFRLMKLRKGPVIAALYPIICLLLQFVLAAFIGCVIANLVFFIFHKTALAQNTPGFVSGALYMLIVSLITYATLAIFRRLDRYFFAYYLMHTYAYTARLNGKNPPELQLRMSEFEHTIRQAWISDEYDEILIVGHSFGAHIGVSILANMLRNTPQQNTPLAFLSLGQVVPMVSFLPNAYSLRADLAYLSASSRLSWVDVTAPGDGCTFALCDPVAVTGVAPQNKIWPLVISASFSQTLSPDTWKHLRWRFFRLHFWYLYAFDLPKDYDYFQITAGPITLAQRYKNRSPSTQKIDIPINHFTHTEPL